MVKQDIKNIFNFHNLNTGKIKKINIGFTNDIYQIDEKYILKIYKNQENELNFEKEYFFLKSFSTKTPVPKVVSAGFDKNIIDKKYLILEKVKGVNLYQKWDLLDDIQRKNLIKQITNILKHINSEPLSGFIKKFNFSKVSWMRENESDFYKILLEIEKNKILTFTELRNIREFIGKNIHFLKDEKQALVYWDIHFDNFLIDESNNISAILDFEAVDIYSIDFVLDMVYKIKENPLKFATEEVEEKIDIENYQKIDLWFKEFYPELFDFDNLDKRLKLYALKYDLNLLLKFPKSVELKEKILKNII